MFFFEIEIRKSRIEGRESKVENRKSRIESRVSKVEIRRSKFESRVSKVVFRRSCFEIENRNRDSKIVFRGHGWYRIFVFCLSHQLLCTFFTYYCYLFLIGNALFLMRPFLTTCSSIIPQSPNYKSRSAIIDLQIIHYIVPYFHPL